MKKNIFFDLVTARPFATPQEARDALRARKAKAGVRGTADRGTKAR